MTIGILLFAGLTAASDDVVKFSKKMYSALGSDANADIAKKFKPDYNRLNTAINGTLGQTLEALFEMRIRDLKISIKHAKKMRKVLDIMQSNNP
jgi:hypothetical protein